jgi:lactate permease
MLGVWPVALVAGVFFAIPQFLISNFHGPWLVDIVASISSLVAIIVLLQFWKPKTIWKMPGSGEAVIASEVTAKVQRKELVRAWFSLDAPCPYYFWFGVYPSLKKTMNTISAPEFKIAYLHNEVSRTPPIVPEPTGENPTKPEEAIFKLNWLSATGTGILIVAIIAGFAIGYFVRQMLRIYAQTLWRVRFSLITIAAMLGLVM